MRGTHLEQGSKVAFRLSQVYCPDPRRVLEETTPEVEVVGEVMYLSDRGEEPEHFAVIQAAGILRPVVVPVSVLKTFVEKSGIGTIIR